MSTPFDPKQLEKKLARDLSVIMEQETDDAFRTKQWDGTPWPATKSATRIGSLMIRSGALRRSVLFKPSGSTVHISSSMFYADIHNRGGSMRVPVTTKMRQYFWAMYHKTKDERWRAMALSKKNAYTVRMPRRQFTGITQQTDQRLQNRLDKHLEGSDFIGMIKAKIK